MRPVKSGHGPTVSAGPVRWGTGDEPASVRAVSEWLEDWDRRLAGLNHPGFGPAGPRAIPLSDKPL